MLEVFRELVISGDAGSLDKFVDELTEGLADGWRRDLEREARVNDMMPSSADRQYAFQWSGEQPPAAALFLIRKGNLFEVTNIVPKDVSELSRNKYNAILRDFAERNVHPTAERLRLAVNVSPDHLDITDWLSEVAADRLRSFSRAANKETGSSHPMDFRRWAAFLIQAHRENARLDSETLRRWLVEEERWREEKALGLAIEFEFAQELLSAYDKDR